MTLSSDNSRIIRQNLKAIHLIHYEIFIKWLALRQGSFRQTIFAETDFQTLLQKRKLTLIRENFGLNFHFNFVLLWPLQ